MHKPANINVDRPLQMAIEGRETLLQIPAGCYAFTDDGIECTTDDTCIFAAWHSIQWLEQSDDIDSKFNDGIDASNHPFNHMDEILFNKCLRNKIIISDDNVYRVRLSNQRLGNTPDSAIRIINGNDALKAFLMQEVESADNDELMNAITADDNDDEPDEISEQENNIPDEDSPVTEDTTQSPMNDEYNASNNANSYADETDDYDDDLVLDDDEDDGIMEFSPASSHEPSHPSRKQQEKQMKPTVDKADTNRITSHDKTIDSTHKNEDYQAGFNDNHSFGMTVSGAEHHENTVDNADSNKSQLNTDSYMHITSYEVEDMTDGNASTADNNGIDWIVLMSCTGFNGSIVSRWKNRNDAIVSAYEMNQDDQVKSSMIQVSYDVYQAKGNHIINRKYQIRKNDGSPDSSYNEWGEKIKN